MRDIAMLLEEVNVPNDVIESVLAKIRVQPSYPQSETSDPTRDAIIRAQIAAEPDWRRRAALQAFLISQSL